MDKKVILVLNKVNFPRAEDYKHYDHRTHVYLKPDTYIGSDERVEREVWIYNFDSKKMVKKNIDFVPGCERIYLEILTNAADNVGRSRRANIDPGPIEITMNKSTISIKNYGLPIPIEKHSEQKIYIPQMIFGTLLTSSNYDVDRHEAGTNGIGAKATNIFSTEFSVEIHDHIRKLKYRQSWYDNMTRRTEPVIEQYNGKISSVQVIYTMDFKRFKYNEYPLEAMELFARHAIDISFTCKTKVFFNSIEFNMVNIKEYARLYFEDKVENSLVHYQWPEGTNIVHKRQGYQVAKDPSIVPQVELIILDTPDEGQCISFVNGIMTHDGGVHVQAAIKAFGEHVIKMVNDAIIKKLTKQNKGKELDSKQRRSHTITIQDLKPHVSLILSVRLINPKFTSQAKTNLQSPVPKIEIPEERLKVIHQWNLIDRLYAALEAKQFSSMTKTDGKLKSHVKLLKGIDANNAGRAERHRCVLYITEGRSGAGYANKLISLIPQGRDYIGVLPMRGKSLNVMNADRFQIEKNVEIGELKKMLGLCEGLDYTDPRNFNKLRYGSVMIMADSDVDGKHIIGLIINFFHCRFPSLLARNFVSYYRTPILRVFYRNITLKFYTQQEYEQWKNSTSNFTSWKHKYYKGLGTSKDSEIKDDYNTPCIITCFYDSEASKAIRLAFDRELSNERKKWLDEWFKNQNKPVEITKDKSQPISEFIHKELILFSVADLYRSIPKLIDGFKESQRKVIYGAHKKWRINKKGSYQEIKVAQFSAFIAECSNYHHGEIILDDVIIGMTQNFTGSNNLPWFTRDGQFGTRYQGGKDAAETRYSYTKPERWLAYILREEDQDILKSVVDDGEEVEPEVYFPIIPMILVNGAQGIGTGYSTFIPNYNPLCIIRWLEAKLHNEPLPPVTPWYQGFQGTIEVLEHEYKSQEKRSLLSMISYGNYLVEDNKVIITELPIGVWPYNYHKWLEELVESKKITKFRDLSVDNKVYFEIHDFQDPVNHKTLKLVKSTGLSNMVLLDQNNYPKRYNSVNDILEEFYVIRLRVYQKRKEYILSKIAKEVQVLKDKIRFIEAVINNEINIIKRKITDIYKDLEKFNIPKEIYNTCKASNFSQDEIHELLEQVRIKEQEYVKIQNTSCEDIWFSELEELKEILKSI